MDNFQAILSWHWVVYSHTNTDEVSARDEKSFLCSSFELHAGQTLHLGIRFTNPDFFSLSNLWTLSPKFSQTTGL